MTEVRAAAIVAVLLVVAAVAGVSAGVRDRPAPTPRLTLVAPSPEPTPTPVDPAEVERRAFAQPLSAGCSTGQAVWVFADGGATIRFAEGEWTLPDPTLRSLLTAACRPGVALAVGRSGSIVTADDDARSVRVDRVGSEDLTGVALLGEGALAVGTRGTAFVQSALDWTPVPPGTPLDLYAVAVGPSAAWVVGARGAIYRVTGTGWETGISGTSADLRAVVAAPDGSALAAGDAGTAVRWDGRSWSPLDLGTDATFRSGAVAGASLWLVGDRGTAFEVSASTIRHVDLGTACTLRAVFPEGGSAWIIGSDGLRGAAWRVTGAKVERWGSC